MVELAAVGLYPVRHSPVFTAPVKQPGTGDQQTNGIAGAAFLPQLVNLIQIIYLAKP
ncbi:MAG: hypothetical protein ABR915_14305 [Thermoguttaceae bacterium]|jgi:hypothetical protein